jgi:hypothetical protein
MFTCPSWYSLALGKCYCKLHLWHSMTFKTHRSIGTKGHVHGAIFAVQFLQLAMQFYSWEMLISEISEEFSICWENISGV